MIHSVFWLTGMITWGLIAAAGTTFLVADIHDRLVMRRDAQRLTHAAPWTPGRCRARQVRRQYCRI